MADCTGCTGARFPVQAGDPVKIQRRTNLLWGFMALAAAALLLANSLGLLPSGAADLLGRAWPALLVIAGLSLILRDRVPFGSLLALVIGLGLAGGLAAAAYSGRAALPQDDTQVAINQPIGAGISLLRVQVTTLDSDVEIVRALNPNLAGGQFVGSAESEFISAYEEAADGSATLTLTETQPNPFPLLEAVGRGRLQLELPAGIPIDLSFNGTAGNASLNLSGLSLERLNFDLRAGNMVVTLPEYRPLGSPENASLGTLIVREGGLTVQIPPTVAARLELNRGGSGLRPEFDPTIYNLLADGDGVLEARNFDSAAVKLRYTLTVPRGLITVTAGS